MTPRIIKLIAHRGNISGRNPERENSPEYIREALDSGYDAEIDVWYVKGRYVLGHDKPTHKTDEKFLENDKLWCHAKNLAALERMLKNKKIHCFWAQSDAFPITSRGVIWAEPGKELGPNSICVMPEMSGITGRKQLPKCLGVCSDIVANFK